MTAKCTNLPQNMFIVTYCDGKQHNLNFKQIHEQFENKFIPETDMIKATNTHPVPENIMTGVILWSLARKITNICYRLQLLANTVYKQALYHLLKTTALYLQSEG